MMPTDTIRIWSICPTDPEDTELDAAEELSD